MKTALKTLCRKAAARVTRRNLGWFLRSTVLSWVIQGAAFGALTAAGASAVPALVAAKTGAWAVWAGQCVRAWRAAEAE